MLRFPIIESDELNWIYFIGDEFLDSPFPYKVAKPFLLSVKRQFDILFGEEYVNSHKKLIVLHHPDGPETFRHDGLITLGQKITNGANIAYQFSHELCHYMVPQGVCENYRWFEEVLCHLMSVYVLTQFQKMRDAPSALLKEYNEIMLQIRFVYENATKTELPISEFIRNQELTLQKNCYKREYNRAIAIGIALLFEQFPSLWKIIPYLHTLQSDINLENNLHNLLETAGIEPSLAEKFIMVMIGHP